MKITTKLFISLAVILTLTACGSKWQKAVSLTAEEIAATKTEIANVKEAIKNFKGPEGEIPNLEIIQLAEAYQKLGDLKKAADLYLSWLDKGFKTKAIIHNLGRVYEDAGQYELAVKQYQRIIDEYGDDDYLYDITWTYIKAAQNSSGQTAIDYRKKAEKYFNLWQLAKRKTDNLTQETIKKLREGETK